MVRSADTEELRFMDTIKAVAWKEAMDAGCEFVKRKWIVERLGRSLSWVSDNWTKSYENCLLLTYPDILADIRKINGGPPNFIFF